MGTTPHVFVGGSVEARGLAARIATVIQDAGMAPVSWDTGAFRAGRTLLEEIERFPGAVAAAVLLATPDVRCSRRGEDFRAPVANVLFEYGYLGGRLTRDRVAVLRAEPAVMPSDAAGVKLIELGEVDLEAPRVTEDAVAELRWWITDLPSLAPGLAPTTQLHGYSGRWEVHNNFSTWRDFPIEPPDQAHYDGVAVLVIPPNGQEGSGVLYGTAHISLGGYRAVHHVANEIRTATVGARGELELDIEVGTWSIARETGAPPHPRVREELRDRRFRVVLRPDPALLKTLRGRHDYEQGLRPYSVADEVYVHKG